MTSIIMNRFALLRLLVAALSFLCPLLAGASYVPPYAALPAGTEVQVRVNESLSSATANVGDGFTGTLASPIVAHGRTVFPKGANVSGRIFAVERSGRLNNPGELRLELRTIHSRGRTYRIAAKPFILRGESHAKNNAGKIGGGMALGAVIGALAGGEKGAALGAGVGAAAGTGVAAASGKREALVESEAVLVWVTANSPNSAQAHSEAIRASRAYRESEPESALPADSEVVRASRLDGEPAPPKMRPDREDQPVAFSARDRHLILECFSEGGRRNLPPGLAKRDRLPPGLERQVERNGTLPPGLQKRADPLPERCEAHLARLPDQWSRVVLGGRILLLDSSHRVVDLFWLTNE